jgi:hypothetical protein
MGTAGDSIPGVSDEQFMKSLIDNEKSSDPNYPGQYFTKLKFPDEKEVVKMYNPITKNTSIINTKNKGFAVAPKR